MSERCSVKAHVRNSKGEVVESRLFNDLLHHLSNRETTKEFYKVGTSEDFLNKVRDKAQFDENGEITFNSLRKLANIDINQENLLSTLNKDIKSGVYPYNDAINRLQSFNRGQFNSDYMATVVPVGGKYELKVVPRTSINEANLERTIANRTLMDRIMYRLNKAGVGVEFLEEGDKIGGRYSTINAKKTADGLYNLIRVSKGEKLTMNLAEEAGHFAIGSLGNSPLVERLTALLTPDVQKQILGEEYDTKALGASSTREVAGTLVGKALMDEVDNETVWGKLANRIVGLAKRIYATFKGDEIMKDSIDAERIARNIARNFMTQEQEGGLEKAMSIRETLYSASGSLNTTTFRQVVNGLAKTVSHLKAISNDTLADKVNAILGVTESGRINSINANPNTSLADMMSLDGITEALSSMLDMIGPGKEINNILDSVDFLNTADFFENMAENGRKLRQVHTFATNSVNLMNLVDQALKVLPGKETLKGDASNVTLTDSLGNAISVDLYKVLRDLKDVNESLVSELMNKEKQFFLRFCEDSLGSKYVWQSSKVIWNLTKKHTNPNGKTKFLFVEKGKRVDIGSVLNHLESDINIFERFIGSMSNNPDIIGQIADKVTKMANMKADQLTNQNWDELRVLESRFKNIKGIEQADLFEKFDDGSLTGNIVSDLHWGKYEKEWKEFKDAEFENFKTITPNLNDLSEFEKALRWDAYFRPLAKDWHKTHSEWDDNLGRYAPNDSYVNPEFQNLVNKHSDFKNWYNDYMTLKVSLDSRLPEGSTLAVRAPQFKGTYMNIVRNQNKGFLGSHGSALRTMLRDTFCESSEDTDFGSDQTYNSEEEELFANSLAHEKEKINRIPVYGINKLKDMNELSTDLFYSTLAYAGMANTNLALSQIVDTLEVGSTVMNEQRTVGNDTLEKDRGKEGHSRAYSRYIKFLDKQVYGISSSKTKIPHGIVIEKVIATLSSMASKYFLGGNVVGGAVNTMTGFNELFKEAIAAEEFSLKDFKNANKLYFSNFVQNWMEYGKEFKENKIGLFIRHFNALGENRVQQRDWHTVNKNSRRIYNMFNESIFLPYKSGDHYMQSITYLSLAHKIKLYDEHGNKISLINAYKVTDNTDLMGNKGGKTLELAGTFFKGKNDKATYDTINSIVSKMEAAKASPLTSPLMLTAEEQNYINSKGYNLADADNTIRSLKEDATNLTWTDTDESAFMDRSREINNRMHGIYNNQDKVAWQQNWFGNAVLAMRGYALGMMERRFAPAHYSVSLGHDVEGSLSTVAKVLMSGDIGIGAKIAALAMPINLLGLPMGDKARLAMYKAGFSKTQVANMRRNWGDMLIISMLWLLKGLTAPSTGADGDDGDDDNIASGLIYYFANRLYREQAAFNTPSGLYNESTTLADMMPVGGAALFDIATMGYELGGAMVTDETDPDFYYQSRKEGRYEEGDAKGAVHFWRMFPYLRSVYTFEHPYESAKSFEYGKNIKAR